MKVSSSVLALLLSTLVAADGFSLGFLNNQKPLTGERATVPGENPLSFCDGDHANDILIIDHVNLSPNPPER
jgi:hypothetical protein